MSSPHLSPPVSSPPHGVDLSGKENGFYAGFVLASVLLGITIVQAWIYVNTNEDRWPLRTLVTILVILDITTTVLNAEFVHHYLIKNFGNLAELSNTYVTVSVELLITIIIACIVELFFASRVHKLDLVHWVIPVFIVSTALAGLATGTVGTAEVFKYPVVMTIASSKVKLYFALRNGFAALSDIAATIALLWSFSSSKTGFKRTDTLLQKLFQYTVTRGLLVTLFQLCLLATYTAQPASLNWFPFHLGETKIYVITMVSMLNSRPTLRGQAEVSLSNSDFPSTLRGTRNDLGYVLDVHSGRKSTRESDA